MLIMSVAQLLNKIHEPLETLMAEIVGIRKVEEQLPGQLPFTEAVHGRMGAVRFKYCPGVL